MRNYLIYAIFVLILGSCGVSKKRYYSKIYDDMYSCHEISNLFADSHKRKWTQFDFLNRFNYYKDCDTIFILETIMFDSSELDVLIWNKDSVHHYDVDMIFPVATELNIIKSENSNELFLTLKKDNNYITFTKQMINLVSEWNISEIRNEENINSTLFHGFICATRIVFSRGKYNIDCFSFRNFYNFKRDQLDYLE